MNEAVVDIQKLAVRRDRFDQLSDQAILKMAREAQEQAMKAVDQAAEPLLQGGYREIESATSRAQIVRDRELVVTCSKSFYHPEKAMAVFADG